MHMADRRQTMNRLASEQTRATACRLVVAISLAAHNSSALAEPGPCRAMEYERSAYTVCEVDLRQQTQALLEAVRRNCLCVSLRPAARARRRGRQTAIRHQRRHVRSGPQACGALCATGARVRACKHHVGLWQFSHEAEWGLLCIRR